MHFYTNFYQIGNKIRVRGYLDGKRFTKDIEYKPYLFVPTKEETEYKTIYGQAVGKIDFDSIKEAKDFVKEYKDIPNYKIFGSERYMYNCIHDNFHRDIDYDPSLIRVGYIDIETRLPKEGGFPDPKKALQEISAVTIGMDNKYVLFGTKDFDSTDERLEGLEVEYRKYLNEDLMLRGVLAYWQHIDLDIISGWNSNGFDLLYLFNRLALILGNSQAQKLSPYSDVKINTFEKFGREQTEVIIRGIECLDYIETYKRFSYTSQASYKLENVCQSELGTGKVDHSEYENLDEFYEKDPQGYYVYNIIDTARVYQLETKRKLIETLISFSYDSKINYSDSFTTVLPWDCHITSYLMNKKTVVPQRIRRPASRDIMGGYVKDIERPGMYPWIVSYDANSLYPHIIMYLNIGPETIKDSTQVEIEDILYRGFKNSTENSMSAIGTYFSNDSVSFISEILEGLYNRRKEAQAEMKVWRQKLEGCAPEDKKMIEANISKLNGKQHNSKIKMNALYGAMANEGFRFFHPDMAESITATGQLIIRWAGESLNAFMNEKFGTKGFDYIVYTDTDSVYLNLAPLIEKYSKPDWDDGEKAAYAAKVGEKLILPYLEKKIEELGAVLNAKKPDKIKFKMEKVCRNSIFSAKKKYVLLVPIEEGVTYDVPKVKVTGLESVRSSTPNKVKDYIKEAFKIIMTENEAAIQNYISKTRADFKALSWEDIAFPRGVNDLEDYTDRTNIYKKGSPINVRAALLHNSYLEKIGVDKKYEKIYSGDKIKFCYLKVPNPIGENVIASKGDTLPVEFKLEKYLDYDMQFMKTFLQPIENILGSVGWTSEPVSNLEDWFT